MVDPRYYASTVWRSTLERPVGPQFPTITEAHWGGGSELLTMANEEEASEGILCPTGWLCLPILVNHLFGSRRDRTGTKTGARWPLQTAGKTMLMSAAGFEQ